MQMTKGRAGAATTGLESRSGVGSPEIAHMKVGSAALLFVFSTFPGNFYVSESRGRAPVSPCWVVDISEAAAQKHI